MVPGIHRVEAEKLAVTITGTQAREGHRMNTGRSLKSVLKSPAWICFVWFGMTAGVSLLATPVRFTVESMTRPVGLDVARVVFMALNKAEFIALIVLLILVRISAHAREYWMHAFAIALILLVQAVWLIPELSARTDIVISGGEPPESIVHGAYSTLELLKLTLLGWLGFRSLKAR
jgi:hypothetical protein